MSRAATGIFARLRGRFRPELPPLPAAAIDEEDREERYRPIEWPLIRRCMGLLYPYRKRYALGIALGAVQVLLEMASPKYMQHVINYVIDFARYGGSAGKAAAAATPAGFFGRLVAWVGALVWPVWNGIERVGEVLGHVLTHDPAKGVAIGHVLAVVVAWVATFACALTLQRIVILIMTYAGESVQFDIRRRIFAHLQDLSMGYYDRTKLGRIISRCTSDINAMREVNVWGINTVVQQFLMMTVAAAALLQTDWRLFLSVAWLGPILYVTNRIYRRKAAMMQQIIREHWSRVASNLAENITGMRVVTAFNRQEPNLAVFNTLQIHNTENNVRNARLNGLYQPMIQFVGFFGKVIILTFGGYLVVSGQVGRDKGVGAVVAAFFYWDWFMNPIVTLGNFINQLMAAMAGAERIFSLLDTTPEVADVAGAGDLPRIEGRVRFEGVTFGYNPERPVLHDVSFEVKPGEMVALVGATGSGKSSIISLIARFYQPQKGRILVDEHDIRCVTGKSLHKQMGLVLQVNYLFTGTVMENIKYVKPEVSDEEVMEAARKLGTHELIMDLTHGYDTEVGERGASMSLGQRQLICFTRAFLADPRIFMLDEATSAVDTATELLVQRSLEKLLEGRTTFIVAHRLSTIMKADQILVIEQGRIIERGTHRELVGAGGKYAHLYEQFVLHSE